MKASNDKRPPTSTAPITIGRKGFAQVSAVEGIRLTDEMWAEFQKFDQEHLSNADRRKAIARKYAGGR
ncbi:MAG: hypothetical protein FJX11_18920 [Alphaproteobacteria bacterium]|nr:hypothetical protein [Alphaproteobacteria bacterium]